eukprot:Rmarinus@m.25750
MVSKRVNPVLSPVEEISWVLLRGATSLLSVIPAVLWISRFIGKGIVDIVIHLVVLCLHLVLDYVLFYVAEWLYTPLNRFVFPGIHREFTRYGKHSHEYLHILRQLSPKEHEAQLAKLNHPLSVVNVLELVPFFRRLMYYLAGSTDNLALNRSKKRIPVVYIHGGGFICNNTATMVPSMTPYVREGHDVYMVEYPYAPYSRFPTQIISSLRALKHVRESGIDTVALVGDSAGGNIAAMVALFLGNPDLFDELRMWFLRKTGEDMAKWSFPKVTRLAVLYGLLDRKSFRGSSKCEFGIDQVVFRSYASHHLGGRITPLDYKLAHLRNLPPTLVIVGTADIIYESSLAFYAELRSAGVPAALTEYPNASHGFTGMQWSQHYWPSMREVHAFLDI